MLLFYDQYEFIGWTHPIRDTLEETPAPPG